MRDNKTIDYGWIMESKIKKLLDVETDHAQLNGLAGFYRNLLSSEEAEKMIQVLEKTIIYLQGKDD